MRRRSQVATSAALAVGVLLLVGCGSEDAESNSGGSGSNSDAGDGRIVVEAAFYPLLWMAEEIGGDSVDVSNLTKPGSEPHDLELTPQDLAALSDADVIVYLSGFQPSVDEAVADSGATTFDAADAAELDLTYTPIEEGEEEAEEAGSTDPHFWLDPTRFAKVAESFVETLSEEDPDNVATYEANAETFLAQLEDLDAELEAGLADCQNNNLVTSHNAFGYLADRYGLEQVGITGLTPETEPSAGQLADVTMFVKENDVRTIYFETLVSPDVAEAVANEASSETAVLDPIEGLTDDSKGRDYLEVMRSNLESLQAGQPCS